MRSADPPRDASASAAPPHTSPLPHQSPALASRSSGSVGLATPADRPAADWPRALTWTTPVALVHAAATTSFCSVAPRSAPPRAVVLTTFIIVGYGKQSRMGFLPS